MKPDSLVIMMLGGGRRVSLAQLLKRSGKQLGLEVKILSYELERQMPIAIEGEVIGGLPWDSPNVVDDICRVAIQHEVDMLLPLADGAVAVAARCKEKLGHICVMMDDVQTADILYDRTLAAEAFKKADIPSPATYSIVNARVPAIAKPRKGSTALTIKVFDKMENLMSLENLSDYFLQEFITDCSEYCVECFVDREGNILTAVPIKKIEVMGKEVTRAITCDLPLLTPIVEKVITTFSLRGPVSIELLHDRRKDRYVVSHVNPRMGDIVTSAIYAGAPLTDYLLQSAKGITMRPCSDWAPGTLTSVYAQEAIFYDK